MRGPQNKFKRNVPFFMNSARLQTSQSYFKSNHKPEKVYDFLLEPEADFFDEENEDLEQLANQGYYGMPRFIPLKTSGEDDPNSTVFEDRDDVFIREVNKWMGFGLIWLTMRQMFTSTKKYFRKNDVNGDLEAGLGLLDSSQMVPNEVPPSDPISPMAEIKPNDVIEWNELTEIDLLMPTGSDSSLSTVYADETANIQQFQMTTPDGRNANVIQFSVGGLDQTVFTDACQEAMDFKSLVLSENCASLMWVWNEQSCIVLITESPDPCCWSVQQWFRKILSDMALTDSIMIGHPYYWHPVVRRKLRRAMKQFKKLYKIIFRRKLSEAEADFAQNTSADSISSNLEMMYPRGITQVTIAGDDFLTRRPSSNAIAEDIVTNLCGSWGNYHGLMDQNKSPSVDCVSTKYFSMRSDSTRETQPQSTTFLRFLDSEGEFIPSPGITMVSTLDEVNVTDTGNLYSKIMKENVEGDHATIFDDPSIPIAYGNKPLESRWDDKAFKQPFLTQNMTTTSSEVDVHKKRSKHNRQRKLKK